MRPLHRLYALPLSLSLLVPATASAQSVTEAPRVGWMPSSRVSVGSRLVLRVGPYTLGGVGGQVAVRLGERVTVDLFTDHMVGTRDGALRHDHEVGTMLRVNLTPGSRWAVAPMVGACANLAVLHAAQSPDVTVSDIQFGARAGLGVDYALPHGISLGGEALALAYLGHALTGWAYRAESSPDLSVTGAGQVTLHANLHF